MKITSQKEFDSNVKNGVFLCTDNLLEITCDIKTNANIKAGNIDALDINARNIDARNIDALDIDALDIDAGDINALDINAKDINYYASCISYKNIKCTSITGSRENSFHKCLDGELIINETHTIEIDGKKIELSEESFNNLKNQLGA